MKNHAKHSQPIGTLASVALLALALGLSPAARSATLDSLYVGDAGDPANFADDTIKRFDARTGAYLGVLVRPVPLDGPMGLVARGRDLYVANQNIEQPFAGDVLRYSALTGRLQEPVVSHEDPKPPFAPRGLVLGSRNLFVADFFAAPEPGLPFPPGDVKKYTAAGDFVRRMTPQGEPLPFYPRGVVIGPDGLLYVSSVAQFPPGLNGQVLRFEPRSGRYLGRFVSNLGTSPVGDCTRHLHRPEGLVFGPDGHLYVTSFRADASDVDRILVFAGPRSRHRVPGSCLGSIALDELDPERASAQALLFGPGGDLFVPITNASGPPVKDTGAIRRYRIAGWRFGPQPPPFTNFVAPSTDGKPLGQPWYLTFGRTDPATLAYRSD